LHADRLKTLVAGWVVVVMVGIVGAVPLFASLGQASLFDWDEAVYAERAKEMLRTGDWLTLQRGYQPSFHKPPMYVWTTAVFFRFFEVSELWARVPSALSGLGVVMLTVALAIREYGRGVGVLSALILLMSTGFLWFARSAAVEVMFTFFVYLTAYGYFRVRDGRPRWWYLVWVAGALALLVKSAIVFLVAAPIALDLLVSRRALQCLRSRHFWQAGLLALCIAAPWHVVMYVQHGQRFIDGYVVVNILRRATGEFGYNIRDGLYYLRVLYAQFFPWLFLLPFALAAGTADALRGSAPARFFTVICALTLLAFSLAPYKLPWYIVPMYPAAAILIAAMLRSWVRVPGRGAALLVLGLAAVSVARPSHPRAALELQPGGLDTVESLAAGVAASHAVLICILLLALLILAATALPAARAIHPPRLNLLSLLLLFATAGSVLPPVFHGETSPVATLARGAADLDAGRHRPLVLLAQDDREPSVLFYSDRHVVEARDSQELVSLLVAGNGTDTILSKASLNSVTSCCTVEVVAESGGYVYGSIRRRDS
jgi:4-amino-4-deoxy-L-arabinose transferase-like glycosyltransferase